MPAREEVVACADGSSDAQARWTPGGRLLPIIGSLNHLAHAEWRWIEGRYLGRVFPERVDEFAAEGLTLDAARAAYWNRAQRTDDLVRAAPRRRACGSRSSPSRWICGGRFCTSSKRRRTTRDTPIRQGSYSTVAPCACERSDRRRSFTTPGDTDRVGNPKRPDPTTSPGSRRSRTTSPRSLRVRSVQAKGESNAPLQGTRFGTCR